VVISKIGQIKAEMEGHFYSSLNEIEKRLIKYIPEQIRQQTLLGTLREWYRTLTTEQQNYLHSDAAQEVIDVIRGFTTEHSYEFLKQVVTKLSGVRPEDWNDSTAKIVSEQFALVLEEVTAFSEQVAAANSITQFQFSFIDDGGKTIERTFLRTSISPTGELLQNVLHSYLRDFGDAVSKNEKRQILLQLLENMSE
jgi:hypothetical protein